jgi:hypothetical protein
MRTTGSGPTSRTRSKLNRRVAVQRYPGTSAGMAPS